MMFGPITQALPSPLGMLKLHCVKHSFLLIRKNMPFTVVHVIEVTV
jgi:hypothetical protein